MEIKTKKESFLLKLCFYRSQAETEEIIALMRSLMFFQPESFRSSRKDFKRIGCKNFWEQLKINLSKNEKYLMQMYQYPDSQPSNYLTLRYSPVTGIIAIRFDITNDEINILSETEKVVKKFAENHHIISASIRSFSE